MSDRVDPGIKYGYPDCCRNFFGTMAHLGNHNHFNKFKETRFIGTGYVPCFDCMKKDPVKLVEEINAKRDPSLPPFEQYHLSFEDMMKEQSLKVGNFQWPTNTRKQA